MIDKQFEMLITERESIYKKVKSWVECLTIPNQNITTEELLLMAILSMDSDKKQALMIELADKRKDSNFVYRLNLYHTGKAVKGFVRKKDESGKDFFRVNNEGKKEYLFEAFQYPSFCLAEVHSLWSKKLIEVVDDYEGKKVLNVLKNYNYDANGDFPTGTINYDVESACFKLTEAGYNIISKFFNTVLEKESVKNYEWADEFKEVYPLRNGQLQLRVIKEDKEYAVLGWRKQSIKGMNDFREYYVHIVKDEEKHNEVINIIKEAKERKLININIVNFLVDLSSQIDDLKSQMGNFSNEESYL